MHLLADAPPANSILVVLVVTLAIAAWTDYQEWRIPNRLLAPSAAVALMLSTFLPGGQGIILSLLGATAGVFIFLPLYLLKGMGAGDIKLMGVVGLYVGPDLTLDIALLTALIGGVWVIALLNHEFSTGRSKAIFASILRNHSDKKNSRQKNLQNKSLLIPYGVVIAIGTLVAVVIASYR